MKEKVSKGHPIVFSIMLGVILTVLVTFASAISSILKFNNDETIMAQTGAFLVMAVIITVYMTSNGRRLSMFGFHRVELPKTKEVLYYIPLLVIALVIPTLGGINTDLSLKVVMSIIIFTFLVGYTEEFIFRGIIKEKLKSKGGTFYIIFSSIFFGVLHMANGLNGDILSTILQVLNAFLVGIILSQLITVVDNIIPLISFHFMYDALAYITKDNSGNVNLEYIASGILTVFLVAYASYLFSILKNKKFRIGKTIIR
ncbi:lysostaphin resistance A-like protein [Clostridium sp.]|uniref:CPBP family intramembrane glutamic endopeptidase n=1 Tax=Clostridium sp. TaxID=1506 RepID=UPI003F4C5C65